MESIKFRLYNVNIEFEIKCAWNKMSYFCHLLKITYRNKIILGNKSSNKKKLYEP